MEIEIKRKDVLVVVCVISVLAVASTLLISCSKKKAPVEELSGTKLLRGTWAWDNVF